MQPTAQLPALSQLGRERWMCQLTGVKFEEAAAATKLVYCDACATGFDRTCVALPETADGAAAADAEDW